MNEINFIRTLQRFNTPKRKYFPHLLEFYDSEGTFYLSQEMMEGKTLGLEIERRKREKKPFTEEEIKIILLNILEAIDLMHESGIIHRDIKPDNIMFTVKGDLRTVRIVDFGLATFSNVEKFIFPRCGTPGYAAPEILNLVNKEQTYSEKCDLFSVGSLLYKIFTLSNLFRGKEFEEQLKLNKECEINFNTPEFLSIPQDGQDIIKKLLEKDPKVRLSAKEALGHPFLFMERIKEYEPSKEIVEFIYMDEIDEKVNDTFKN